MEEDATGKLGDIIAGRLPTVPAEVFSAQFLPVYRYECSSSIDENNLIEVCVARSLDLPAKK